MSDLLLILLVVAVAGLTVVVLLRLRPTTPLPADPVASPEQQQLVAQVAALRGLVEGIQTQTASDRQTIERALGEGARGTQQLVQQVAERLVKIDTAQAAIGSLQSQVTDLVTILGNNQARGAFGEATLEAIVQDILPPNMFEFQATLSTGTRVDCLIRMPDGGDLGVDSKFPLEGYRAFLAASDDAGRAVAVRDFSQSVRKHVDDIAAKYVIPPETREIALMFIPAESIYLAIHTDFDELRSYAHRKRIYLASPNTLHGWLTSLRSVYINTQLAEQAALIRDEVRRIVDDVGRLDDRVDSLERHFDQAQRDIKDIRTSANKVVKRGERISSAELATPDGTAGEILPGDDA